MSVSVDRISDRVESKKVISQRRARMIVMQAIIVTLSFGFVLFIAKVGELSSKQTFVLTLINAVSLILVNVAFKCMRYQSSYISTNEQAEVEKEFANCNAAKRYMERVASHDRHLTRSEVSLLSEMQLKIPN
ncbi:O-antigen ligase [Vibrio chagasii]|nr:O-antigen ligase [Vibrio chagasii]